MELELDLKLARVVDEFHSADLHIAKDRGGPLFISKETETLFILSAHLQGYKTKNVKIEINEDGSLIMISGEKAIQQNVFVGWKLYKKETEIKNFKKTFKIPDGVILDKIKASFEEDESILTISMPKNDKGIRGLIIKEVEEHVPTSRSSETLHVLDDPEQKIDHTEDNKKVDTKSSNTPLNVEKLNDITDMQKNDHGAIQEEQEKLNEKRSRKTEITESPKHEQNHEKESPKQVPDENFEAENNERKPMEKDQNQGKVEEGEVKFPENDQEERPSGNMEEKGSFKICVPAIAGSAFLLSLVVLVIHYVKTKTKSCKRNN